ncbi:unnamed protein product [Medioppia subpectinata]|uniref:Protein kinase domain-containing protein n=1 Tax=Medioppia subpectinata TaxID=1979941 RepID=A0A7R9L002_9ACAR|nr:unnamed protein product [Medioppia subpectinata]CAG2112602.1 unnamed protein product [Medioppia subpectinata]
MEQISQIGRGGFGEVYQVKHITDCQVYAVKIVKFLDTYDDHKRKEILKEVQKLLECVKYLHDSCPPVIHRDLKPSNVLISQNSNNNRFIKLCDFGSATYHEMTSQRHTSNVGTSQYMAPETIGRPVVELSTTITSGQSADK